VVVAHARFAVTYGKVSGGNSTVESHSSKVMVAGSNPVPRSKRLELGKQAALTQKVEEHGQGEIRAQ
jgi:hypothetical protein